MKGGSNDIMVSRTLLVQFEGHIERQLGKHVLELDRFDKTFFGFRLSSCPLSNCDLNDVNYFVLNVIQLYVVV